MNDKLAEVHAEDSYVSFLPEKPFELARMTLNRPVRDQLMVLCASADRPDSHHDNLVLTRLEEHCLDAEGWLTEAAAALVPVTPAPGVWTRAASRTAASPNPWSCLALVLIYTPLRY